ncbi:MAG: MaoC family dehydratase [Alphaproteobacteria bacterium]|nr:MaoC family dehydratase [Alphaproteobacteria bacterium]
MRELHGAYFEDLKLGQTATFGRTITDADIVLYAGLSGDTNPIHLNHDFASPSMFRGRIAHGMLTAGLISTVFGTKLPGPGCIYISQSLNFRRAVRAGDTVLARCTVTKLDDDKKIATFATLCTVNGKSVLDGEALIMVPTRP